MNKLVNMLYYIDFTTLLINSDMQIDQNSTHSSLDFTDKESCCFKEIIPFKIIPIIHLKSWITFALHDIQEYISLQNPTYPRFYKTIYRPKIT